MLLMLTDRADPRAVTGPGSAFADLVDQIGPTRRAAIITAGQILAEQTRNDTAALGANDVTESSARTLDVLGMLPPITWRESRFWRHRFAGAATYLTQDTQQFGAPIPRCIAEQLALHMIIHRAAHHDPYRPRHPHEPAPPGWEDLFTDLFADHDVLTLYNTTPPADTIDAGRFLRLHPGRWYTELDPHIPVPSR